MDKQIVFKKFFPEKEFSFFSIADGGEWKNYKVLVKGNSFKASKCYSVQQAKFVQHAAKIFLKHKMPFPKILKRYNEWLLQEWVEGEFAGEKVSLQVVKELAEVLAKMHSISLTEIRMKFKKPTMKTKTKFILKKLAFLNQNKIVSKAKAEKLAEYLAGNQKQKFSLALTQRDFTTGNIFLRNERLYKIIDYEDTCIEIKELDIARTIFVLKLNEKQEKAFLKEYSKFSSPKNFEENKKYWMTMIKINNTAISTAMGAIITTRFGKR